MKRRAKRLLHDLDQEIREHIELVTQENMDRGMTPEQARHAARRKLGNQTLIREEVYGMNSFQFLETIWQDVRYSLRTLAKSPAFTFVVVLSLALGIGANTAIFSLIDAVLLKMLPVSHPEQLVNLTTNNPDFGSNYAFPYPAFKRFRDARQIFTGALAFYPLGDVDFEVNGQGGVAIGQAVSGDYFQTLGVSAIIGRTILPEDDKAAGQGPVAVLGYDYWRDRFGLDPAIVGRQIVLNNTAMTIVGVTPPEFYGVQPGQRIAVSVPLCMIAQVRPGWAAPGSKYDVLTAPYRNWPPYRNWLHIMARLRPGAMIEQALAGAQLIQKQATRDAAEGLAGTPVDSSAARRSLLETKLVLSEGAKGLATLRQQFPKPLYIVMAIVGLLLLVTCANVANLLLARANSREKQIAVRLTLGAGRRRLIRQLITESVLLACGGGALGLLLAFAAGRFLLALMSHSNSPVMLNVRPDSAVLTFTLLVSLLTALLFGLVPAWRATGLDLTAAQMQAIRSAGRTTRRSTLAKGLAVLQIAVSVVLLIGAGLLARSLGNLENFNPGFSKDHVLLFSLNPDAVGYGGQRRAALYQRLLEALRQVPGVRSATLSIFSPLSGGRSNTNPTVIGYTPPSGQELTPVDIEVVAPSYFETLRIPLLLGRDFTSRDRDGAPKVAVVNQAMARHYFGNSNPIGRRFSIPGWLGDPIPIEIVGLAADVRYHDLRNQAEPMAYLPFLQLRLR